MLDRQLLPGPGEDSKSVMHSAVDAFITALNDGPIEFEVMKLRPKTLQEAADCATRHEAYADTVRNRPTVTVEQGNGKSKVPVCSCSIFRMTAEAGNGSSKEATLLERLGQLQKQLEQVTKGNRDVRGSSSRKASSKKEGSSRGQSDAKSGDKAPYNRQAMGNRQVQTAHPMSPACTEERTDCTI